MRINTHYLAAITAFTVWGFFSLALRPLSGYPSLDILFYRVFFSAVLLFVVSAFLRRKIWTANRQRFTALPSAQQKGLLFQLFGGGFFLTGNWFFFIYVTNEVSIKAAAFAYLVCPVLTTVLAWLILKEHLTRGQWIAVLLSAAGCGMLSFHHLSDLLYSLAIAFSYAIYLVIQRKDYGADRFLLLTGQVLFAALLLLPFYPSAHGPVPGESRFYILISIIAVFLTIFPLWLNLYALKGLRSSTVGILLYITPVLSFVLALTVFGEKVDGLQMAAYGDIVLAVALFNWFNPAMRVRSQD